MKLDINNLEQYNSDEEYVPQSERNKTKRTKMRKYYT